MNKEKQNSKIYDEVINCIRRIGLPVIQELSEEHSQCFTSEINTADFYSIRIMVVFVPDKNLVSVGVMLSHSIPQEKHNIITKLTTLINQRFKKNVFDIEPGKGVVNFCDDFFCTDENLDIDEFLLFFKKCIGHAIDYFPLIVSQYYSELKPKTLYRKFMKRKRKDGKKSDYKIKVAKKDTGNQKDIIDFLPFDIHGSSQKARHQFPTHTHGLDKIGLPEFIIDPLALGPEQNSQRIFAAYDYFLKPENNDKLDGILNGEVIELKSKELHPNAKDDSDVYCFREVPHDFEAVKMAYSVDGSDLDPDMRFVQIWLKGDDHALNNEYYRGGIIW